jgi:hypothetical protein
MSQNLHNGMVAISPYFNEEPKIKYIDLVNIMNWLFIINITHFLGAVCYVGMYIHTLKYIKIRTVTAVTVYYAYIISF